MTSFLKFVYFQVIVYNFSHLKDDSSSTNNKIFLIPMYILEFSSNLCLCFFLIVFFALAIFFWQTEIFQSLLQDQ